MMAKSKVFVGIFGILIGLQARANFVGTDYQNFNPTYSMLDFTSVHSSEILRPCLCNLGIFFNWAKNTLTYSESYVAAGGGGTTDLVGTRTKDSLTAADVVFGFGVSENLDIGIALPFVVTAKNDDPYGVSYFDQFGLTEFRPSAKYRFTGDKDGGLAAVLSVNLDQIKDNPFAGKNPGPTVNLEFVGDTTVGDSLKLGFNLGYRKRNPGERITNPTTGETPPFVPIKDSIIYSVAAAQNIGAINADIILEIKGGTPVSAVTQDTKRSQEGLEWGLGLRKPFAETSIFHAGVGTKLADSQASPDFRIHAGYTFNFGTACDDKSPPTEPRYEPEAAAAPRAVVSNLPAGESDVVDIEGVVSAVDPVTFAAFKYKLGPTSDINCQMEEGYSDEMAAGTAVYANIKEFPDGNVTFCAVAKNSDGVWQSYTNPTIYRWVKYTLPAPKPLQVEQKDGYELFRLSAEVLFDFDKDDIRPTARPDLDRIADYLRQKPFKQVVIEGHTDNRGSDAYNNDLSKRRAQQVINWLVNNYGFTREQFRGFGRGERFPVVQNTTDANRQLNRRVEFKVYR